MGDVGEMWREHKHAVKKHKAEQLANNTQALKTRGVAFTSHNDGLHLVVESPSGLVDFWPSTGRHVQRSNGIAGRGIKKLLAICEAKNEN